MIKINYLKHDKDLPDLKFKNGYGNSVAIDLYVAEDTTITVGNFALVNLGVSIQLPKGYKAELRMRSSTFAKWGLIQTNGFGLIDTSYSSDKDIILLPVFMLMTQEDIINYQKHNSWRTITIPKGTSICQLEILPCMEEMEFNNMELEEYKECNKVTRGGFGNTCHNYIQHLKLYDNDTKMGKSKNIIEDSETNSNVDKDLLCDVSSISNQWERKDYWN